MAKEIEVYEGKVVVSWWNLPTLELKGKGGDGRENRIARIGSRRQDADGRCKLIMNVREAWKRGINLLSRSLECVSRRACLIVGALADTGWDNGNVKDTSRQSGSEGSGKTCSPA